MSSAQRRLRRDRERQDIRAAIRVAKKQGCTCSAIANTATPVLGVPRVEVAHHVHCCLMRSQETPDPYARSRQIVVYRPGAA
jgi:hypothetical protein